MSLQYLTAAKLVTAAEKGKSLKSLCASMPKLRKVDYALAMQTLKYLPVLKDIFEKALVSSDELDVQPGLLNVMAYELIFGDGKISGGGAVKRKIMAFKETLLLIRDDLMSGKQYYDELLSESVQEASSLPLYVRVNEVKVGVEEALTHLLSYDSKACVDDLIPSLIQLSPQCRGVSQDSWIKEGKLIIQDKASCFPAQILYHDFLLHQQNSNTSGGSNSVDFIDACAAPGNKTSHLATLLHSYYHSQSFLSSTSSIAKGSKVMAFDKSLQRAKIIKNRINLFDLDSIVSIATQDFLTVDVNQEKYTDVEYLLLDPSCSGSGIVRNIERILDQSKDNNAGNHNSEHDEEVENKQQNRLYSLQAFQISVIQKAMTLPNAHSITYSTCSIHNEENEEVVSTILSSGFGQDWELAAPIQFDSWNRRGIVVDGITKEQADMMIRCRPSDGTNGFFVALFRKKKTSLKKNKYVHQPTAVLIPIVKNMNAESLEQSSVNFTKAFTKKGKAPSNDEKNIEVIHNENNNGNKYQAQSKKKEAKSVQSSLFGSKFKVTKRRH